MFIICRVNVPYLLRNCTQCIRAPQRFQSKPKDFTCWGVRVLFELIELFSDLWLIHTRHFCTQYFDKKIFFLQNIVVTFQNIFKQASIEQICLKIKYFQFTQEKNIRWKMSFYLFYHNMYCVPKCLVCIGP